ncbi:DUF4157 domain-containing protein [Parasegetibacter sp. MAH-26]|uniref:DUF4157 domain-containing protein n=2 Tax=Pinibacter aurantiacus TaxID=2851599 RepID=A0A9E2SF64_9BACT|nr:DUF4157 domain-containing protein [Pinibacter aurantiacus]
MFSYTNKTTSSAPLLQAKAGSNTFFRKAGEESFFGTKEPPTFFNKPIQAKLTVSTPDDPHEKEADAVADKVMRMHEPVKAPGQKQDALQRKEEEEVHAKHEAPVISKIYCKAAGEEKLHAKLETVVHAKAQASEAAPVNISAGSNQTTDNVISLYHSDVIQQSGRGPPASSIPFEQTLSSSKGNGSALPDDTKQFMESRFNADFSGVRVHTDQTATQLTSSVNAKAFAHGNDIYFNKDQFSPHSNGGGTLLAHELTHTIQQGASKSNTTVSNKTAAKESTASEIEPSKNESHATEIARKEDTEHVDKKSIAENAVQTKISTDNPPVQNNIVATKTEIISPEKLQPKEEEHQKEEGKESTIYPSLQLKYDSAIDRKKCHCSDETHADKKCVDCKLQTAYQNNNFDIHNNINDTATGTASERGPPLAVQRSEEKIQRSPVDDALGYAGPLSECLSISEGIDIACVKRKAQQVALHIPGYKALRVVLGEDPITGESIAFNGRNFIEACFDIVPGGELLYRKLDEIHKLDDAAKWIDGKIAFVKEKVEGLKAAISAFLHGIEATDITSPLEVLKRGANIVFGFIKSVVDFAISSAKELLKMIKDFLLDKIVDFIKTQTTAYPLLTVILGKDPITEKEVARNGTNILNALLELGGDEGREQRKQMQETGTFKKVANFIDEGIAIFSSAYQEIVNAFHNIWNVITIQSLMDPIGTFSKIYNEFAGPIKKVWDFVKRVGAEILKFIKEVLMVRLSTWAKTVKGYTMVTVIIGKDPFTDAVVPRTVENIIHGFMSLMDGGEEQFNQMKESGAIAKAEQKINAAVKKLNMTPQAIIQLFIDLWNSFSIKDLANPIAAFQRILAKFGEPIARLIAFVVEIVKIVVEVILIIMQFPFDLINNIIAKAMQAFEKIKADPIGFLKNLLRAIKEGFMKFFDNILKHLLAGLTGWLMSELKDANVKAPADFSLKTIIGWVLDLLGISMEKIWDKLAKHPRIGPARVAKIRGMINKLEGIWTFIKDVQERGMAAIWDKIVEKLNNLWDTVLDAIKNWIMEQIVNKMVTKLLSMLDPTGIMAVVNSAIALYKAIQSFIKYLKQMLEIVNSFVEGTVEIANGNTKQAATFLEGTLARGVPVVIGFLANQIGLSGVGKKVGEMIEKVRDMVDKALTWLVNKAVDTAFKVIDKIMGKGGEDDPKKDLGKDQNYVEDFSIGSEGHKITTSVKNNQFIVTMASNEDLPLEARISKAIASVGNDSTRDQKEKNDIMKYLNPALVKVKSLRSDYETYVNTVKVIDFSGFVKPKITAIISSLRPLEKYKVEGIHDLISAPKKRKIPSGFNIRKNLYDKTAANEWKELSKKTRAKDVSNRSKKCFELKKLFDDKTNPGNESSAISEWKNFKDTEYIPSWAPPITLYDHARDFSKFEYEADHKDSLGVFWNASEKNKGDNDRKASLLQESNLQVLTKEANGKKSGVPFDRIVGDDFESAVVLSPKGSNKLGDLAFEEG